jgi:predicted TIM-barrel fold metal-dependent hydrolase
VIPRRGFLAGSAALLASCAAPSARRPGHPPVVDTHLHCFAGPDDPRFPYHQRAPYRPAAAATPEHLLKCMDGAGVDFAVVVHPEPYQDDHRYLEHCLAVGGRRLRGTALVFADRPGSAEKLPDLAKRLGVISARIHAYAPDRLPPFGKPELRALWKSAADLGLAVQLHFEPRWAGGFEPYLSEFKATTVIIDHLGRPLQGTPEEHERVVGWAAKFPHTVMKLSSYAPESQYPHRDIAPIVRRLSDAYGPDRMIYGGGFGEDATPASYRASRERARSLIGHLSAADQAKILGGTAARLFNIA